MASHRHHAIDYIEISVRDIAAAKSFYSQAFGWELKDYGPSYVGIQVEGREQGGLSLDPDMKPGGQPLVVLFSSDLDESVSAVKEAGGEIVKPPFKFPGGRRFHFKDPSGNELAVWSER